MNIIIIGSNGMLGSNLAKEFSNNNNFIIGISKSLPIKSNLNKFFQINFMDPKFYKNLETINKIYKPDLVINCSGLTSLEVCEKNYEKACFLNGEVNKAFLNIFHESRYFYISTDSVFDGLNGNYDEMSQKKPINNYAKSKSYGEDICLGHKSNAIILRTNIYGLTYNNGPSILNWAKSSFENNKNIDGFYDYIFNPLHVSQVAEAIKLLNFSNIDGTHIFHIGVDEYISKFDFLYLLKNRFPDSKSQITKVKDKLPIDGIKRPKNTSLNTSKFKSLSNKTFTIIDGINEIF